MREVGEVREMTNFLYYAVNKCCGLYLLRKTFSNKVGQKGNCFGVCSIISFIIDFTYLVSESEIHQTREDMQCQS